MITKFKSFMTAALVCSLASGVAFAQDAGSNLLLPPATYPAGQTAQAQGQTGRPAVGLPAPAAQPSEADQDNKAFHDALKLLYPNTPEQHRIARQAGAADDKASNAPLTPIQPVSRSVRVSLRSGDAPPVIHTTPGWISTITFADVTGQPWPVLSVTNGNPDAYDVKNSGAEGKSNIVTISSKLAETPTNVAITLVDAKVPVMLQLSPSSGAIDFRVDAQLDVRGPNASADMISSDNLPATGDSVMLGFLDGVPPSAATKVKTSDGQTQAWRYNDMLYVRTPLTLLSPAYVSKQSSVVGFNVYVLNEAPVMVMSGAANTPDSGRLESVTIQR